MTTEGLRVEADDFRRPAPRPLAWLRRHPTVVDAGVTVVACAPHLMGMVYRHGEVGWWGYPLIAVTAIALLLRRRRPFAVLMIVAVACALSPLVQPGFIFPMLPFSFALFTVATRQTALRAVAGYAVAVLVTVLMTVPYSLNGLTPPLLSLTDPFSLLALAAGIAVKSRRDHRERLADTVNRRIDHAALAERSRIAAEMHDVVAHSLTVIVSLANGATSSWRKHPEQAVAAVERIGGIGRDALDEMHRTLSLLRDSDEELDEQLHRSGGNLPALDELAARFDAAGLPVAVHRSGPDIPADTALRQAVYRIVQESLTNSLRHATNPTGARVTLDTAEDTIVITIEDDGEAVKKPIAPGYGLVGIRQRAASLGGRAESAPHEGGGWRVVVELPAGACRGGANDD